MVKTRNLTTKILVLVAVLLLIGVAPFTLLSNPVYSQATNMPSRSLIVESSKPSDTNVLYNFTFDLTTPGNLGSILFKFCSNGPLINDVCVQPSGFDATGAVINSQFGETGFSIHPSSDANNIIITRAPVPIGAAPRSVGYEFSGITNADSAGSQYVRVTSYVTNDASGPQTDEGGIAFSLSNGLNISTYVPPYLLFCSAVNITSLNCADAEGSGINLGILNDQSTAVGTSQMLVATNADFGYTIRAIGTTMTSGNHIIDPIVSKSSSTQGTNQFGLNLRKNTIPNVGQEPIGPGLGTPAVDYDTPNQFKYTNGDILAYNNDESDLNRYTVTYVVNISEQKEPGVYSTTLSFLALASF